MSVIGGTGGAGDPGGVGRGDGHQRRADGHDQVLVGAGLEAPQGLLACGERLLDRVEVGRIGRQDHEPAARRLDQPPGHGTFVDRAVVEHHHLAGPQGGDQSARRRRRRSRGSPRPAPARWRRRRPGSGWPATRRAGGGCGGPGRRRARPAGRGHGSRPAWWGWPAPRRRSGWRGRRPPSQRATRRAPPRPAPGRSGSCFARETEPGQFPAQRRVAEAGVGSRRPRRAVLGQRGAGAGSHLGGQSWATRARADGPGLAAPDAGQPLFQGAGGDS